MVLKKRTPKQLNNKNSAFAKVWKFNDDESVDISNNLSYGLLSKIIKGEANNNEAGEQLIHIFSLF
jgi:hypothetical protein